jgi:hypothetical protein
LRGCPVCAVGVEYGFNVVATVVAVKDVFEDVNQIRLIVAVDVCALQFDQSVAKTVVGGGENGSGREFAAIEKNLKESIEDLIDKKILLLMKLLNFRRKYVFQIKKPLLKFLHLTRQR